MTPEEHVYASIRSNPDCTIEEYQKFTRRGKEAVIEIIDKFSKEGMIELRKIRIESKTGAKYKSGWRVKPL